MTRPSARASVCILAVTLTGCALGSPAPAPTGDTRSPALPSQQSRSLVVAVRSEPDSLSSRPLLRPSGAFDSHALGQPRIERIQVRFIADSNTVVANLLAEEVHLATDDAILSQQWFVLRREWSARDEHRRGIGLVIPSEWRRAEAQHRLEYTSPRAILDVRVRKAHVVGLQGPQHVTPGVDPNWNVHEWSWQ